MFTKEQSILRDLGNGLVMRRSTPSRVVIVSPGIVLIRRESLRLVRAEAEVASARTQAISAQLQQVTAPSAFCSSSTSTGRTRRPRRSSRSSVRGRRRR